ncbi:COP23 domain-containing protein [Laspinema olomoucense]|uniref:COP23 domain-containing protein n=1 Tax=Laspinema olomoucense D3b TaxID=2953688 RepID=A0ABT2N8C7_9CYAN|nr:MULTISPECIES: COP23 domain-containing protein [unclassified Laspinema]MCT7978857.1 COP23 domain-containing protein [Laspinema sp. D3b]MCT7996452.1 COP23 domain-containing protein [Laspinema sp. D3c]
MKRPLLTVVIRGSKVRTIAPLQTLTTQALIPVIRGSQVGAIALLQTLTAATLTLAQPQPPVETTSFFCGTVEGIPATMARTPNGEMPMVIWDKNAIKDPEINAQQQCEEVSNRFQTYYDNGTLNYITSGIMNGELVACVAPGENAPCSGILFPLSGGSNPRGMLQRMFRIRVASAGPIAETTDRLYISFDKYLNGEYPQLPSLGSRTPPVPRRDVPQ